MTEYHKIQSLYKRDPDNNYKTFLTDQYTLDEFEYLYNNYWVITEKVDGMNIRIIIDSDGAVTFGGKTDKADIPKSLQDELYNLFIKNKPFTFYKNMFPDGAVLYGEGYGGKIQKGSKYSQTQKFVLFDAYVKNYWLDYDDLFILSRSLDLDIVPRIGIMYLYNAEQMVREGFTSDWGDFIAEGVIAKPLVPLINRFGNRIITKIKHVDYQFE